MLTTAHGVVQTPAFLPCATHGVLRGLGQEPLKSIGLQTLLSNAYHLYLRPGIETIERLGGLHQLMGWDRAILTDSGGFQAFALPRYVKYEREGIVFRSHIDGSKHFFTPELVIDIQERLGVDIATCLDVCTGFPVPEPEVAQAVDQTNQWAEQSVRKWTRKETLLYGMVQGSIYPEQRRRSAECLRELPFSGFAIGGNMYTFGKELSELAREKPKMWQVVEYTTSLLPSGKPRHLLGVGEPSDLIDGVKAGIDTFDCVMPTRLARHNAAWVRTGSDGFGYKRIDLARAGYRFSTEPLDPHCTCPTCQLGYQRGYLRHLAQVNDPWLGALLSVHNVAFLASIADRLRQSILRGTLEEDTQAIT